MSDEQQQNATPYSAGVGTSRAMIRGRHKVFLSTLAETGVVTSAARAAGIDRSAVYRYRDAHPDFAEKWEHALETAADHLEAEAVRRGVDGWEEPVYQGGLRVGTIRKYSDNLLIRLLSAKRPEFRNQPVVQVTQGGDLAAIFKNLASRLPD